MMAIAHEWWEAAGAISGHPGGDPVAGVVGDRVRAGEPREIADKRATDGSPVTHIVKIAKHPGFDRWRRHVRGASADRSG